MTACARAQVKFLLFFFFLLQEPNIYIRNKPKEFEGLVLFFFQFLS